MIQDRDEGILNKHDILSAFRRNIEHQVESKIENRKKSLFNSNSIIIAYHIRDEKKHYFLRQMSISYRGEDVKEVIDRAWNAFLEAVRGYALTDLYVGTW